MCGLLDNPSRIPLTLQRKPCDTWKIILPSHRGPWGICFLVLPSSLKAEQCTATAELWTGPKGKIWSWNQWHHNLIWTLLNPTPAWLPWSPICLPLCPCGSIILPQRRRSCWSPSSSRPPGIWPDALSATPARPAGTRRTTSGPGGVLTRIYQCCLQLQKDTHAHAKRET